MYKEDLGTYHTINLTLKVTETGFILLNKLCVSYYVAIYIAYYVIPISA